MLSGKMNVLLGGRAWGKRDLQRELLDEQLKRGHRVLVIKPSGCHVERLHRSGLRIITPVRTDDHRE